MSRFPKIAWGLILLALPTLSAFATDFPYVAYRTCYDGDTCRFDIPGLHPLLGNNIPIRFAGVDTPEMRGKCQQEKDLALKARNRVRDLLSQAHSITLKDVERRKYFHLVATVEADGQDMSDLLLQEGLAVVYDGGGKTKDWCK